MKPSSLLLPIALLLTGCSAGILPVTTPTVTYPSVTGNWQFGLQLPSPPNFSSGVITELAGALASSGTNVTGTLRARALSLSPCVDPSTDIPVTGTIDASGNLTLNAPVSGGTATLTTTLNPLISILTGTFVVTGGACAQPSINASAYQVPNVTGTYTGTLTQVLPTTTGPALTLAATVVLAESTTPDIHAVYALTGTVTTTGSCALTLPITNGSVLGDNVSSGPATNGVFSLPPLNTTPSFGASATPASLHEQILANLNVPINCPGFAYTGVLTRP